jgi:hypothetical protein
MDFCSCALENSTKKLEIDCSINITPVNILWNTHCANSKFKFWTPSELACPLYKTTATLLLQESHVQYRVDTLHCIYIYTAYICSSMYCMYASPCAAVVVWMGELSTHLQYLHRFILFIEYKYSHLHESSVVLLSSSLNNFYVNAHGQRIFWITIFVCNHIWIMNCFDFLNQRGKKGLLGHVPDIVWTMTYSM